MPWSSQHVRWLVDTGNRIQTADGREVEVLHFNHVDDPAILSAWAQHFRTHYCRDAELVELVEGTGLTARNYLLEIKFPDRAERLGPSVRAGDFSEILVADYVQYVLGFEVPRIRYALKINRNESAQGDDLMGFKKIDQEEDSPNDELISFEVKAALSRTHFINAL